MHCGSELTTPTTRLSNGMSEKTLKVCIGSRTLRDPLLEGWFCQLEDEGYLASDADSHLIPWDTLYALQQHPEHVSALALLELPSEAPIVPSLASRGTLEDESFGVLLSDWWLDEHRLPDGEWHGAVYAAADGRMLMPAATWMLLDGRFERRPPSERNGHFHRLAWGRIWRLALRARARLDAFLHKSVVPTPEKLAIGIRKSQVADDTVIEVQPSFDGAPAD